MKKLAVLISNAGTGTNLQAIIDATKSKELNAEVILVVSDAEDAKGLKRAKENNIPTLVTNSPTELEKILKEQKVDFVCLAGWKQIIPDFMIKDFKILNVHPGLIPNTLNRKIKNPDRTEGLWNKGMFTTVAIENFLNKKATYAGCSVHFLSDEFDFGEVLKRGFVKIEPNDSIETLYERLKKEENRIYVEVLKELCNG